VAISGCEYWDKTSERDHCSIRPGRSRYWWQTEIDFAVIGQQLPGIIIRMSWYYAQNNEKVGPISDGEFDRLVGQGTVTPATLVWREGMPNWQAYGEIAVPARAYPPAADGVRCIECGDFFTADEVIKLSPGFVCGRCKPVVMQKISEGVMQSGVEEIRKAHINHEASVRSIGALYFLGGLGMLMSGIISLFAGDVLLVVVAVLFVTIGAGLLWLAWGLHKLRRWARIPTGIVSGLGLLGFPLGTIINGYILYLVFSQKGATVFSEEYKQVIAETPHIKYRTSIVAWIVLGLLLLGIVSVIIFAVAGTRR